jgi:flagellar motor switch protein FliN
MAGDPPIRRHDCLELPVRQPQLTPGDASDAREPLECKEPASLSLPGKEATLEMLDEVELNVRIELGRTQMYLKDVLKLRGGSVVALDKLAGDPVDVLANGRIVARGEVVVLSDNFCVRVTELVAGDDGD